MSNLFHRLYTSPKRTLFYGLVLLIFCTGIFFRSYHFSEWLHFETDQVDDYFAVSVALEEGVSALPLVGPKAAGTDLRLGPAFYMLEYLSGLFFGNTPAGHARIIILFSILTLPLFFLVSRILFEKITALCITGIFATSHFAILYSRFSWNPNLLPFFTLATLYTLHKALSEKNSTKQTWWLSSFAIAFAITIQLHTAALITFPIILFCFFLWKRPSLSMRSWICALVCCVIILLPTIAYEIHSNGQTTRALLSKTTTQSSKTLGDYIVASIQNIRYHAGEYTLILTGVDRINDNRPNGSSWGLTCPSCAKDAPIRVAGYMFLIVSLGLLIRTIVTEKDTRKKDIFLFILLWLVCSFVFFFSIMLSGKYLYPRFFLLTLPLPLFFFGLILQYINPKKDIFRFYIVIVLTLFIIFLNIRATLNTFSHNERALTMTGDIVETEDIFPNTGRITYEQQLRIADVIATKSKRSALPVYLKSESEYEPSLWLLLNQRGINFSESTDNDNPLYQEGLYVFVFRTASPLTKSMKAYQAKFTVQEELPFGSLSVRILSPKPEFIIKKQSSRTEIYAPFASAQDIPRWRSVLP